MFLGSHKADLTDVLPQWHAGWWHSSTSSGNSSHTQEPTWPLKTIPVLEKQLQATGKIHPHPVPRMGWAYAHHSQRDIEGKGIALRWGWKNAGCLIRWLGTKSRIPCAHTTIGMYLPCELPASDWLLWGKGRQCCWNLCTQGVFVGIWLRT